MMKKNFFRSAGTFLRAFPQFLAFELIFKLLLVAVGAPALTLLLKLTMKAAGVKYLSDERMRVYLKHPLTIVVVLVALFALAFFTFWELSALTVCFSGHTLRQRVTVGGMFRTGISAFRKSFRGFGILYFLLFMTLLPMAQFTLSSGVFMVPILPMLQTAFKSFGSAPAVAVYILIQLVFALLIISRSYSLHLLILTGRSFRDCTAESKRLIGRKKLKMAFSLILWSIFMLAAAALITFLISFIILLFIKGVSRPGRAFLSSLKVLKYAVQIFAAVSAFFSAPAIMCWLTGRFFADADPAERFEIPERERTPIRPLPKILLAVSLITAAALLNFSYLKEIRQGNISLNVGILSHTQITAHRGFSRIAPENTLYAFEAAVDSGADYIELDVQLTKDGQVVVFHDENLDRTTNGKGKVRDHTYGQLMMLSAGSWFGKTGEYADAGIPLLSDVLELVGSDIMLNIEIKNIGDTALTTEKTVALIEEYDIVDSCYVTSFSYPALKQVKKLNPDIKTGLIANVAVNMAMTQLKYIDALSMNHIFVNSSVVNSAHQAGKRVFVWTVDRSGNMQKMMAMGVDNIITNRPDKCAEVVYSNSVSQRVLTILKALFS